MQADYIVGTVADSDFRNAFRVGGKGEARQKSVIARINIDCWRALKMLAVENDATLNALAVESLNDLLKKYGKRQTVEITL